MTRDFFCAFCTLILFISSNCRAAEPKPTFVVIEYDPWAQVIGADSPVFALYDDGTIISHRFASDMDGQMPAQQLFITRKAPTDKAKDTVFLKYDPTKFESYYFLSEATDQTTTIIWTPKGRTGIYGSWETLGILDSALKLVKGTSSTKCIKQENELRKSLPDEIRQLLLSVKKEAKVSGTSWQPTNIEVMFWPYEYAPEKSIIWPADWPSLTAKNTKKRDTDSYSVYLPFEKFSQFRAFLATRNPKGAILIDGKKMAAAYRFPFPQEEHWMGPPPSEIE